MAHHILVTGCCGFIGSHLTERLLCEGYRVTGIDNFDSFYERSVKEKNLALFSSHPSFRFFEADIRNKNFAASFQNEKFDVVIHLAAKTGIQPSIDSVNDYIDTNITGTANVLSFAKDAGVKKFIFTSSSSVYGNSASVPFSEAANVREPISPYAFTKLAGEALTYTYHHLHGIDVLNLRLFTVFGPRQRPDLAIHKFVRLMSEGKPVKMYGNGTTARDYTFVDDIVNGYLLSLQYLAMHNGVYEILNLGSHHPVKLSELLRLLSEQTGIAAKVEQEPEKPGDVTITYADVSKARQLLGYTPETSIEEGVKRFVEWYNSTRL
jgi:nucleoside-diphosphate-sugar epimerase